MKLPAASSYEQAPELTAASATASSWLATLNCACVLASRFTSRSENTFSTAASRSPLLRKSGE